MIINNDCCGDQIKEDEMGGSRSTHESDEKLTKILVGKCEEKRPLRRHGSRWKDNRRVRMDITKIAWGSCGLKPVADSCESGNEDSGSIKGGQFLHWMSDY
jgi:hypothetical protein